MLTAEGGEPAGRLLGRRQECAALDQLAAEVTAGEGRVLVLRGDPGVGKSVLLTYLRSRSHGCRVVSAAGVESEMELAYGGLHQLCAPLLEHLDRLPDAQHEALATVFGLRSGPVPDRLMVGLAALNLIAEAAEPQPLICLVDDAQWLDSASAQTLAFVARRLLAERTGLVCAARTGSGDDVLAGLPTTWIRGLADNDARTLLLGSVHGRLDAAVCDQIIAESGGNPLALLELPRTWRAADLAGGFGLPGGHSVAGRIEQSFGRRLRRLPADTRLLLLAAAAEPLGDPVLLDRAGKELRIDLAALAPAVDAGLLQLHRRVTFTHPLVRSAVYRAATLADRHRVHRSLAAATDAGADPDRRAWHLARAADEPDESVAAELERSADRAQSRGGLAAAAAFITRAAELTPDPAVQVRRALDAAFATVQAGAFDAARRLLDIALAGPVDTLQQARIDQIRAQLAFASRRGNEATPLLLAAAQRLEPLDLRLARQTYLDAVSAAQFAARLHQGVGLAEVARAVRAALRPPADELTGGDLLLDAFSALADDYGTAIGQCRTALRGLHDEQAWTREKLRWLWQGCVLALEVWDDRSADELSERHLRVARELGALSELPLAFGSRTPVLVFCGELTAAAALVEEAGSVQEVTGVGEAPYGALILAAWRGDEGPARELIESARAAARDRGEGVGVAITEYALAVLCNGSGRPEEALAAAGRACEDPQEMVAHNWGLSELVEAAVRSGRAELAGETFRRLSGKARATGTDWALGMEACAHALLSDGTAAEDGFRRAIAHLDRSRIRAQLSRTHLLYGEWLRGTGRPDAARAELTTAYEMFTAMGMAGFARRARRELLAAGAAVPDHRAESRPDLTEQETRIARLARDGLSNPEIGGQLFISGRTVEWHLHKVFTKLGISSRRQLRDLIPR